MTQITNNENGDMIFNPSMLKTLYERSLKQIAELQEKVASDKSSYDKLLTEYRFMYSDLISKLNVAEDKLHRRNLQIADLKKLNTDLEKIRPACKMASVFIEGQMQGWAIGTDLLYRKEVFRKLQDVSNR